MRGGGGMLEKDETSTGVNFCEESVIPFMSGGAQQEVQYMHIFLTGFFLFLSLSLSRSLTYNSYCLMIDIMVLCCSCYFVVRNMSTQQPFMNH